MIVYPPPAPSMPPLPKTANYQMIATDYLVEANAASGAINITLPSASASPGKSYVVKKLDASVNAVTVIGTIDGMSNFAITDQGATLVVIANASGSYSIIGGTSV